MPLACAFLFLVCANAFPAHSQEEGEAGRVVDISERDEGRRISLAVGDVLAVRLEARLGTGYSWQVIGLTPRLKLLGQTVEPATDQSESGQQSQVFRFRAQSRGLYRLQLRYVRPWQRSAPPAKTFSITVSVRRK